MPLSIDDEILTTKCADNKRLRCTSRCTAIVLVGILAVVGSLTSTPSSSIIVEASPVYAASWAARDAIRRSGWNTALKTGNSLWSRQQLRKHMIQQGQSRRTAKGVSRLYFWEHLFPVLDVIEPLETVWEWYVKRDEIMDGLLDNSFSFLQKKSVQILGLFVISFCIAETLTLVGVLHPARELQQQEQARRKRRHVWHLVGKKPSRKSNKSRWLEEAVEEKFFKRTGSFMINRGMEGFTRVRQWNPKSKFAMAMTAGTFSSQTMIRATTLIIRVGILSFVTIETLSFLGIIGERGESILEWIDDHDDTQEWKQAVEKIRSFSRIHFNFDGLLNLYQFSVDEEKIATFGFALGSVVGIFT